MGASGGGRWGAFYQGQGPHPGQPNQAPHPNQSPRKNAFAWTAPKAKPAPQASTFNWSDGRDDRDGAGGVYEKSYPKLGDRPGGEMGRGGRPSDVRTEWGAGGAHAYSQPGSVQSPRGHPSSRSAGKLGDAVGAVKPGGAAPASNQWPPKLQLFVERAFKQCITEYERECMQTTLKGVIQYMSVSSKLWSTDWDTYPLPRVANASGKVDGRTAKQQQMAEAQKKKKRKMPLMHSGEDETHQEKEAREKRHRRFMDMEGGGSKCTTTTNQLGGDEDQKFISSEAVVGTCMDMDKTYTRLQSVPDPDKVRPERVLARWAERLKEKYESEEHDWEWVTDQFKAVRQDLHIQHIRNAQAITIYESNGRLALLEDDFAEFYKAMTIYESNGRLALLEDHFAEFYKIQSYLAGLYSENAGETENEPEFLAYRLFYWMLNNNTLDFTKDVRAMPKDLQQ
ncbi:SAC3/GANP/Nin1/mts3/eIF-3 p25 family-domain-containing protein, partial [Baffinella frigidus]